MTYRNIPNRWGYAAAASLLLLTLACSGSNTSGPAPNPDSPNLPRFESSAAALQSSYDQSTAAADKQLAAITALGGASPRTLSAGLVAGAAAPLTFDNTIKAFEEALDQVNLASARNSVLKDTSPTKEILDKTTDLSDAYAAWFNKVFNNGSVYKVLRAYANTNPSLLPDETKLMADTLTAFKRNGLSDDGKTIDGVLGLQNEISGLGTDIYQAVAAANKLQETFTPTEMAGVPAEALAAMKKSGNDYVIKRGDRGTLRDIVMTYATQEATRKKAKWASNTRANSLDDELRITTLIRKRVQLAKLLGYNSWFDYKTELNMAKNRATVKSFIDSVSTQLRPKMTTELENLRTKYLHVSGPDKNDDNGKVDSWDVYYFENKFLTDTSVDFSGLKKYFPYEHVLQGMFQVYNQVFGLKIESIPIPSDAPTTTWHKDVRLVRVSNASDGQLLGYVYLDMFPRIDEGKFDHFEAANLVNGKSLPDGTYRKPVAAMICNFPVDAQGNPANMLYSDIDTLFHEFGHCLHVVLSKPRFASQAGFGVPSDFVEVPSTMGEQWRFDPAVFKLLAVPDPAITDAFVAKTIQDLRAADQGTIGRLYERQFAFDEMDLRLHSYTDPSQVPEATAKDNVVALANQDLANTYLAFPENSTYLTSFLHIFSYGYDAGYYSYAWSDSIVSELATVFEASTNTAGYMNPTLGMNYRRQVLEPGASRDVNISVEAFTGHPLDPQRKAFLKRLGIQ